MHTSKLTSIASAVLLILGLSGAVQARPPADPPFRPSPNLKASVVASSHAGTLPDMVIGSPRAKVTVVEYASAACSHCGRWYADVWPDFRDKYVATGKVRFVYREFLTPPQSYAFSAFLIGRCAVTRSADPTDAAPFFSVVEAFYQGQETYFQNSGIAPILEEVTRRTGLSQQDMTGCVTDEAAANALFTSIQTHREADKVTGTPTFFVNGVRVNGHELSDLDAAIASASR